MIEIETLADVRLVGKAFRHRWQMSPTERRGLIEDLLGIVRDKEADDRSKIAAAKALIAAESQNQKDEHNRENHAERNRFLAIAAGLGLAGHFEKPSEIGTIVDSAVVARPKRKPPRKRAVKKSKPDADKSNRGSRNKSAGNRKPKKKGKVSKRS